MSLFQVLTTWFDMYQTLRHLSSLDEPFSTNRPIGKSLFSDVVSLNRTCEDCGIPAHYCPCLLKTNVPRNDVTVSKVADFLVKYMNELVRNVTTGAQLCHKVNIVSFLSPFYVLFPSCLHFPPETSPEKRKNRLCLAILFKFWWVFPF